MILPENVIISALETVATTQKISPVTSFGRCSSCEVDPATVAITPAATSASPSASSAVGIFFSTSTAHAAHTTGMLARITWLYDNDKCNRLALFRLMFTAMNVPIAKRPRHSRFTTARCVSLPSRLRRSTIGASAQI